jgi:uncharacterized protein
MAICARMSQGGWRRVWLLATLVGLLGLLGLLMMGSALAAPAIPPAPEDRVTDRAGVLSSPTRISLDRRLAAYEQQTGHQIIVWIDRSTDAVPIETFAVEAFEAWKIGDKKLDDGLGIFMMTEDRAIRIEVGYGLEPTITDLVASRVISTTMVPAIERGDWDAAVVVGVEQLVDTIEGQPGSLPSDPEAGEGEPTSDSRWVRIAKMVGIGLGAILLLILFITNPGLALLLLAFLGRGGGRGGGNGSGFGGGGGGSGGGGATGRW